MANKSNNDTIVDIARMANTSKTTVSFFINGHLDRMSPKTAERIREVIKKTGYVPNLHARSMNGKKTMLLGVIINNVYNAFSNLIVKGIEDSAAESGYRVLISGSTHDAKSEKDYLNRMIQLGVDGFLIQPTSQFHEIAEVLGEQSNRVVFFDSKYYDFSSSWVKTNNEEATAQAIETCYQRGYRHFLLVSAPSELLSSRTERYRGFLKVMDAHGLSFEHFEFHSVDFDKEKLSSWVQNKLDQICDDEPLLIFAPNCWALPEIYVALRRFYHLMPHKLGLLGFDNTEWAKIASPSISVVAQPAYKEGQLACKILLDMISEKNQLNPHQVLQCTYEWGATTRSA